MNNEQLTPYEKSFGRFLLSLFILLPILYIEVVSIIEIIFK